MVSLLFNIFQNDLLSFIKLPYMTVHVTTYCAYFFTDVALPIELLSELYNAMID